MSYRKYNVGIGGIRAEMKKMGRPKSDNAKKKVLSIRVLISYIPRCLHTPNNIKEYNGHCPKRGRDTFIPEQKK